MNREKNHTEMGKNLSRLQLNRFAHTASEMTYIVSSGALNSTPTNFAHNNAAFTETGRNRCAWNRGSSAAGRSMSEWVSAWICTAHNR